MRAQSSRRRAFGFSPLKAIAVSEAITPVGRRTVSAIDLEPVTRLLHRLRRPRSALTGVYERVWLRRRLYWLRCRIVNANSTQVEVPPARPARFGPGCDPGCCVRHDVARWRGRFFRAQARLKYRRRSDDRAAPFRLEGRAVAANRRPGARHGCAGAAMRRMG